MYKALQSFSGIISMSINEIRDIPNKELVKELLDCGLIEKLDKNESTSKELKEQNKTLTLEIENLNKYILELESKLAKYDNETSENDNSENSENSDNETSENDDVENSDNETSENK